MDIPSFFYFCPFFLCSALELPLHSASSIDPFLLYISKKKSSIYNRSRLLNFSCMEPKIFSNALLNHHLEPQCHICPAWEPLYISINSSLFSILIYGLLISNEYIFLWWRSYTFVLLIFCKPVWILNMCKIKNLYSPSTDQMRIVLWKLHHTKHWVIVPV